MKTTDLIPILLYHLKNGDKYGLELVNACSECSDGKITVKQPTLYSVLKKLEKSKFISSYWQDSDIGGKRHYFKITENGLSQLETYPPLEDLIKMVVSEDLIEIETEHKEEIKICETTNSPSPFDNFSIEKPSRSEEKNENVFDKLFTVKEDQFIEENKQQEPEDDEVRVNGSENDNTSIDTYLEEEPKECISDKSEKTEEPTNQVNVIENQDRIEIKNNSFSVFDALDFNDTEEEPEKTDSSLTSSEKEFELENPFFKEAEEKSIEEKTNLEINEENSKLLAKDTNTEEFVANKNVSRFTEKKILPVETSKKEVANLFTQDIKPVTTIINTEEEIKYQDYVDVKNDKNVKKINKTANTRLYKVLTSSMFSLIVILISFLIVLNSGFSSIYTVFALTSSLYTVYYACNFIGKFKEYKFSLGQNFHYNYKKKFIFRISVFVILVLFILIYNLVNKNSLLKYANFANFLAPLIISTLILVDYIFSLIFYKKL